MTSYKCSAIIVTDEVTNTSVDNFIRDKPRVTFAYKIEKGRLFFMLISSNSYLGTVSRIYRSPSEIRDEMNEIKAKISEANETLSVHNLLMEVMSEWATKEPEKWIGELEETLDFAKESLAELTELKEALDALREELEVTRWALGL